ncbi:MAG TPA: C45 family peptidase [Streptosporangiaceae bacterium]
MSNEVIARHLSRPASPAQRGREFGTARAGQVAHTLARYRELFRAAHGLTPAQVRELGGRVEAALRGPWPGLAEEIDGIAAGAGVDTAELFAANARTEILSGASAPECSVIGVLPGRSATGGVLLAQNWDWHPALAPSRVLWTITGPDGRWLTTLTEAGILAKVGLNSAGLGVTLNILYCSLDGGVGGLPVHLLLRLLLAECDDMPAALALIGQAAMTASSCLTVGWQPLPGDPRPARLVSAELSPGGPQLVRPQGGLLLHTNHFCPAPPAGEDRFARDYPDTLARLADLGEQAGGGLVSAGLIQAALRSHAGAPLSVCCHGEEAEVPGDQSATLASVILDLGRREMMLAAGQPCTVPYELVAVPAAASA